MTWTKMKTMAPVSYLQRIDCIVLLQDQKMSILFAVPKPFNFATLVRGKHRHSDKMSLVLSLILARAAQGKLLIVFTLISFKYYLCFHVTLVKNQ